MSQVLRHSSKSTLRHSPDAETQTNRINNMLRPTHFRDVFVQQGTNQVGQHISQMNRL